MATINLPEETKAELDSLKVIPRETYDDVIKRLIADSRQLRRKKS